jgi:hypothetical protein
MGVRRGVPLRGLVAELPLREGNAAKGCARVLEDLFGGFMCSVIFADDFKKPA